MNRYLNRSNDQVKGKSLLALILIFAVCLTFAGFGQSGEVEDGFLPDTKYASEDINAAALLVLQKSIIGL